MYKTNGVMYKTRNTGTRNGMRGTQGMENVIFLGNVLKHSGKYRQTFRGMSQNISRNVLKHIFVPSVTQGNEDAGSFQGFILMFLGLV